MFIAVIHVWLIVSFGGELNWTTMNWTAVFCFVHFFKVNTRIIWRVFVRILVNIHFIVVVFAVALVAVFIILNNLRWDLEGTVLIFYFLIDFLFQFFELLFWIDVFFFLEFIRIYLIVHFKLLKHLIFSLTSNIQTGLFKVSQKNSQK